VTGSWVLLAPLGLIGLLAIAIPIAIHLISRGRGRRVLIGNIELVRTARQTRVTTPRLTEWLLLLLRILIVLVATLLLARPALQGLGTVAGDASYVTPGWLSAATEAERQELLARQPAPRMLVADYPLVADVDATTRDRDYDIWPLLAERLGTLRHEGTVDVFAEQSAAAFGERRPVLPNAVNWRLAGVTGGTTAFESSGLVIHDGDRTDDVRRLEAALEALKRHRLPLLEWRVCVVDDTACQDGQSDWVVWLSAAEPSGERDGARLYRPEAGEWADAVTDPRFPEMLTHTVLSEAQRRRAWRQVPVSAAALAVGAEAAPVRLPYRSIQPWLATLLILLWAAERLLSERRRAANA
jgi:hypothetical protein